MGWDAYAVVKIDDKSEIIDPVIRKDFKSIDTWVINKCGIADGLLISGGLDVDDCAYMIEKATGGSCWQESWSKAKVKKLSDKANWNFAYDDDNKWAYWSARRFLTLCAKHNLSIKFSW